MLNRNWRIAVIAAGMALAALGGCNNTGPNGGPVFDIVPPTSLDEPNTETDTVFYGAATQPSPPYYAPAAPAAAVTLDDVLGMWSAGRKDEAVQAFIDLDWKSGNVLDARSPLAISDMEFVTLPPEQRNATMQRTMPELDSVRQLASAAIARGKALAAGGDRAAARRVFDRMVLCGNFLSQEDKMILVMSVGTDIRSKATAELAKLRSLNRETGEPGNR